METTTEAELAKRLAADIKAARRDLLEETRHECDDDTCEACGWLDSEAA